MCFQSSFNKLLGTYGKPWTASPGVNYFSYTNN